MRYMHCKQDTIYVFPEMKLRGLNPNIHKVCRYAGDIYINSCLPIVNSHFILFYHHIMLLILVFRMEVQDSETYTCSPQGAEPASVRVSVLPKYRDR